MSLTRVRRAVVFTSLLTVLLTVETAAAAAPRIPEPRPGPAWVWRALEIWRAFVAKTAAEPPAPPQKTNLGPGIDPLGVPKDPLSPPSGS